ncbi:hypothetical protein [Variovorax fucosicus]|uniref:hypothetical protein n=1 Tax=Variovorax fucosicus TaxID=3053517 RepID=UPI0025780891|nr:hypothetical protein [Variovorax sp. J22G47]MDM0058206.1 hypothetical protein [Variovorax sp. J22G47]
MIACRSAMLAFAVSFVLVGCARIPIAQPVKQEVLAAVQPVEVKVGIAQPELYAAFVRSTAGASGAAACGAVPGFGVLLAAACGGAMGAIDASVNASRAKTAEETVRPLKDQLVEVKFDALMRDSLKRSLETVPGMQLATVDITKTVTDPAHEQTFKASTANAVMFVNVDYHLSTDFSTLEMSIRGLLYPRGAVARKAAGQPAELVAGQNESILALKNAVYRSSIVYRGKLPEPGQDIPKNVAAWNADGGLLLRASMQDGIARVGALLAEDLKRKPGEQLSGVAKIDVGNGLKADLLSQGEGGRLLRQADGTLHFEAKAATAAATLASATQTRAASTTIVTDAAAK